ncbi:pyrimidine reductase family protein [Ruania halotolerans]|uniref:pyrimidine reductase family protein n=1 Tax=Ruania halotolerans TaxID=2897773 RepID=UPI001E62D03E|nr:pyrimidine reductase family protein [Ruania halotolerans]UFU07392.1 pyrimidine reductase family protein [Ruania halotolerans]
MSTAFAETELLDAYTVADRSEPHLRANMIASIDGAATHQGLSGGLNGPADKQVFDVLRRLADVVLVGAGTLRAEGYGGLRLGQADVTWRREHGLADHPVLAVVSSRLALEPSSPLFTQAPRRPLLITHEQSPSQQRALLQEVADVLVCGREAVDPVRLREELVARGMPQILCEGGPHLLGTLAGADVLDELCLTVSPLIEGGEAIRITRDAPVAHLPVRLAGVLRAEDMLFLRYLR